MKSFLSFVVGFVAALILSSSYALFAQSTPDVSVKSLVAATVQIETAYTTIRDNLFGDNGKVESIKQQSDNLDTLLKSLRSMKPSLELLATRQQVQFAGERCVNFANMATRILTDKDGKNIFSAAVSIDVREFCAVQINAAKLRLLDYGAAKGFDPFAVGTR